MKEKKVCCSVHDEPRIEIPDSVCPEEGAAY